MSMKNSNDVIGNRTHGLPTCSAVSQPTAPPRTPLLSNILVILIIIIIIISFTLFLKNSLDLLIPSDGIDRHCCVIWRHQHQDIVVSVV